MKANSASHRFGRLRWRLKSDKMSVIVHMSDTGLRPGDEVRVAAFDVERL